MTDVTDPLAADRAGTGGADEDPAGRLQVTMSAHQCAGQMVVALSGELDVTDAAHVGALVMTVAMRVPLLIVDLAGLELTDCAGMRALAAAAGQARRAGGGLVLAAPGPQVLRVLDLTGLMTSVVVYSSVEEAAGITSPQRAAEPAQDPGMQAIVVRLPTVRPGRQQEEGQRDPHQQPTVADTRADCW
jgi:anti-sigma B factor antagonist